MGLEEQVRNSDLVFEIGTLATMTWILVGADVIPGPSVERAVAHAGDVVGRNVVPEAVALVGRAPHRAVNGFNRHADAVANPGRVYATILTLRIECENVGAVGLVSRRGPKRVIRLPFLQIRRAPLSHSVADVGG